LKLTETGGYKVDCVCVTRDSYRSLMNPEQNTDFNRGHLKTTTNGHVRDTNLHVVTKSVSALIQIETYELHDFNSLA